VEHLLKPSRLRSAFFLLLASSLTPALAHATVDWTAPKPEELSMTSEPKAPGAPAIILSYEEIDDSDSAEVSIHVRIKILTPSGVSAATISLPDRIVENDDFPEQIFARTIHRDGTVILFNGVPQKNTVMGSNDTQRVISLSDAEVGSILEYIVHFQSQNSLISELIGYYAPLWRIQRPYFVRSAHYTLNVHTTNPKAVRWVANLPAGTAPQFLKDTVLLDLKDVPAAPDEPFMPPPSSVLYSVRFFYGIRTTEEYWANSGDNVDNVWYPFCEPSKSLRNAVHDLIQPTDTDEQKLRKLYATVMKFENTDFTRERTVAEDKKLGFRNPQNSEDIWLRKRGDSQQLALLFVALARAAGFPAYPMAVTSRDRGVFKQEILSWGQTDALLVIVNVHGHDVFFDPGSRLCPFGRLAPEHANVIGVSIEGKLIKIRYTPAETYNSSHIERVADLNLSPNGQVAGVFKIVWTGTAGLHIRQQALTGDPKETQTELETSTQNLLPTGVQLKITSLANLSDGEAPLVAFFEVSGTLGSATKKRMVLPSQFFEASAKPLFAESTRTLPVAMPSSYSERDIVTLHLPANFSIESSPAVGSLDLKKDHAAYFTSIESGPGKPQAGDEAKGSFLLLLQRIFVLNQIDYTQPEYAGLHDYFGQIASRDQQQIALHADPGPIGAASESSAPPTPATAETTASSNKTPKP